ncbi:MAG: UDP-N-acetylglucosamine 1-carboxyvinyltransferase [Clostridia bacterium]|nr:UDP-N-acetylglucosamine 1-carboxyvinyltransferase [Clostridia bacterium]MBQ1966632.1 UDP-N-acetylglucosamine 1-carboxyvinyltransferase [Clostridia bacterium]MBQ1995445.1 UDP-N-acetylglucosamine 1-carboxyvinyltransferase [Clostridia bacterium]MBQ5905013.1 UDP-N-acetylglucosamine 1-carboxyvinyltransferase [Clostridia bacterium]
MEKLVIHGGNRLFGEVEISGAKNAAVAIIPATLLAQDVCRIENVPNISDVSCMVKILSQMGAQIKYINKHTIEINTKTVNSYIVPHEMTKQLRASYYLIGALLGRYNRAKVALPGGCNFGVRPIDLHIRGFELLGATALVENAMINASADHLTGSPIYMDKVSVGATINIMLAAVKARGLTIIENAAKEPHIVDLANFLNAMGADVRGAGTDVIKIHGVQNLHGCTYSIIPDQIEAGTYMVAAAASGGDVIVKNVIPKHLESITAKMVECGVEITEYDDAVRVKSNGEFKKCNLKTMPHPGFPTDMQPQMAVLLSIAKGTSVISEGVWDNRFKYLDQLMRMGANVQVDGTIAVIQGVNELTGAPVRADDLRAGAAMIIAGLAASGITEIEDIIYIDRGYEDYVEKLRNLGADIYRKEIRENDSTSINAG